MTKTTPNSERVLLVGISYKDCRRYLAEESLLELKELVFSAGAEVVGKFLQVRSQPDRAYLVGRGKLEEIGTSLERLSADLVIFDHELTSAQLRNLENFLKVKVIDRNELILDIFAQRASSREGKLQVELAQLEYLLPRLSGKGSALSRLGGGIGTRGPGETKLEMDRRAIRVRLVRIKQALNRLKARRVLQRRKRQGIPIPTVSIVGYTNAGKSTLFNALANETNHVSSMMFATLDPLVRKISLDAGQEALLTDTVGFVRKLPHTLVAAFRATLEETLEADLILHVIDVAHPEHQVLREAVYVVLAEIGLASTPIVEAYNKVDQVGQVPFIDTTYQHVAISARNGENLSQLLETIQSVLNRNFRDVQLTIPFHRGDIVSRLRESARIQSQEYHEDGIHIQASLPLVDFGRFQQFVN